MLEYIRAGGPVMIPIILLSVLAFGLIIERVIAFIRVRERRADLLPWVLGELGKGRGTVLAEELGESPSPEAAVLREGVLSRSTAPEERELRMQARAQNELARLERFLPWLSSLANVETLLGLLGTVTGMIRSFMNLRLTGVADPAVLAGGISEALITTAAGLMVAIPCLVTYHVLIQSADRIAARVETAATELQLFYAQRGLRR
ncbi:MAG: MotA/TolQ/ExbB proton channel family protein [Spirochaetes bacterium]|nr:MotA/TolQ/ExbB proton channel family protein [Spirochaetota bacterium]